MSVFPKHSKAYGIFHFKCPRCHEGDLYETPTFSFRKPFEMPHHCPVCGKSYFPEPGYYYGAMFVSYIFTGWFCIGFIAVLHWVIGLSTELSFAILIAVLALLFVYIFRMARSIYINLVEKYEPGAARAGKN